MGTLYHCFKLLERITLSVSLSVLSNLSVTLSMLTKHLNNALFKKINTLFATFLIHSSEKNGRLNYQLSNNVIVDAAAIV